MTATATRTTVQDLGKARKEYANKLEEATGYTIAWDYWPLTNEWGFWLVNPCGDYSDNPFFNWDDLVDYCQDAVDEYEELYASIEPKLYDGWRSHGGDEISDADPGL